MKFYTLLVLSLFLSTSTQAAKKNYTDPPKKIVTSKYNDPKNAKSLKSINETDTVNNKNITKEVAKANTAPIYNLYYLSKQLTSNSSKQDALVMYNFLYNKYKLKGEKLTYEEKVAFDKKNIEINKKEILFELNRFLIKQLNKPEIDTLPNLSIFNPEKTNIESNKNTLCRIDSINRIMSNLQKIDIITPLNTLLKDSDLDKIYLFQNKLSYNDLKEFDNAILNMVKNSNSINDFWELRNIPYKNISSFLNCLEESINSHNNTYKFDKEIDLEIASLKNIYLFNRRISNSSIENSLVYDNKKKSLINKIINTIIIEDYPNLSKFFKSFEKNIEIKNYNDSIKKYINYNSLKNNSEKFNNSLLFRCSGNSLIFLKNYNINYSSLKNHRDKLVNELIDTEYNESIKGLNSDLFKGEALPIKKSASEVATQLSVQFATQQAPTANGSSFKMPSESDIIMAMAEFMANRAKKETIIWFVDNLKKEMSNTLLLDAFPNTYQLLLKTHGMDAPDFGSIWRMAIAEDFVKMPENVLKSNWLKLKFANKPEILEQINVIKEDVELCSYMMRLLQSNNNYKEMLEHLYGHKPQLSQGKKANEIWDVIEFLHILNQEFYTIDNYENYVGGKTEKPNVRYLSPAELANINAEQWDVMMQLIQLKYGKSGVKYFRDNFMINSKPLTDEQNIPYLNKWMGKLLLNIEEIDKLKQFNTSDLLSNNNNTWDKILEIVKFINPNFNVIGMTVDNIKFDYSANTIYLQEKLIEFQKVASIYKNIQNKQFENAISTTFDLLSPYINGIDLKLAIDDSSISILRNDKEILKLNHKNKIGLTQPIILEKNIKNFKDAKSSGFKITTNGETHTINKKLLQESLKDIKYFSQVKNFGDYEIDKLFSIYNDTLVNKIIGITTQELPILSTSIKISNNESNENIYSSVKLKIERFFKKYSLDIKENSDFKKGLLALEKFDVKKYSGDILSLVTKLNKLQHDFNLDNFSKELKISNDSVTNKMIYEKLFISQMEKEFYDNIKIDSNKTSIKQISNDSKLNLEEKLKNLNNKISNLKKLSTLSKEVDKNITSMLEKAEFEKQKSARSLYDKLVLVKLITELVENPISIINNPLFEEYNLDNAIKKSDLNNGSVQKLLKTTAIFADILVAQDQKGVYKAIEKHVAPPTSYINKRKSDFSVTINGYVGIFGGYQSVLSRNSEYNDTTIYGLTAPIGITFSNRNYGVFLQGLDLGNLVGHYLWNSSSPIEKDKVSIKEIISPGLNFMYNIPKSPFVAYIGMKWVPVEEREVPGYGLLNSKDLDLMQLCVGFKIDIPFFTLKQ